MIDAGMQFPEFELIDQDGVLVRSSALRGRWCLLYWYPKADTPGCTAQAEGLRDQIEAFDDLDCTVLGASFDEPQANKAFKEKYRLPFSLLSDLNHTVALALGVVSELEARVPQRIAHLVDPSGAVVHRYDVSDPEFFAEKVLDDLESVEV